jgi:predicted Zn-dependent protease
VAQSPAVIRVLATETHPSLLEPVVRVSSRLIAAARRSELGSRARELCWVIAVHEDDTVSRSFVRSDGAITVSSGAFRLAQSEAGLAALLSHELVHALLHDSAADPVSHPASPASHSSPARPTDWQSCPSTAHGPPRSLSTYHEELQADRMGLTLMADAGYDPRELLRLWDRMKRQNTIAGDGFLVHLTYDRRMEQISHWLPDALTRYERAHRAPQKALPRSEFTR